MHIKAVLKIANNDHALKGTTKHESHQPSAVSNQQKRICNCLLEADN
jgi:hypothetical protein